MVEQAFNWLRTKFKDTGQENTALRKEIVKLSEEKQRLQTDLNQARDDYAAIRQLQTMDNWEMRDVRDKFIRLKDDIRNFCFELGTSIADEFGLDKMPISDSIEQLGAAKVLVPSSGHSRLPVFDAFFEFAFRYQINLYLHRVLFDPFSSNKEQNEMTKGLYDIIYKKGRSSHQFK